MSFKTNQHYSTVYICANLHYPGPSWPLMQLGLSSVRVRVRVRVRVKAVCWFGCIEITNSFCVICGPPSNPLLSSHFGGFDGEGDVLPALESRQPAEFPL